MYKVKVMWIIQLRRERTLLDTEILVYCIRAISNSVWKDETASVMCSSVFYTVKSKQCNTLLCGTIDSGVITQQPTVYLDQGFAKIAKRCSILRQVVDGIWNAACELALSSSTIACLCSWMEDRWPSGLTL